MRLNNVKLFRKFSRKNQKRVGELIYLYKNNEDKN